MIEDGEGRKRLLLSNFFVEGYLKMFSCDDMCVDISRHNRQGFKVRQVRFSQSI